VRRIVVAIALGIAGGCLVWRSGATPSCDDVPLLGDPIAQEEVGGAGGGVPVEEESVLASDTRLAGRGGRRGGPHPADVRRLPFPGTDIFLAPRNGGRYDPPPELPEPPPVPDDAAESDRPPRVWRHRTPWEPREQGDSDLVRVRPGDAADAGVTERAYTVQSVRTRLTMDLPELGPGPTTSFPVDFWGLGPLITELYARTGEPLWRTTGTWIGMGDLEPRGWQVPVLSRQTAAGHRAVEAVLDDLLHVGGDARTIRVWRGELGPGTLEVGEVRRVDASVPWRAAAERASVAGPLELDVPVGRAVAAFLGEAHVHVADYDVEISQVGYISAPNYDLAHEGLSVRARSLSGTEELEFELVDVRHAPPFEILSASLGSGPASTVTIELPAGQANRAVVRLAAREGEAWIIGLGDTRAALVEVGRGVDGAGPKRPGWTRYPSLGISGVPADPEEAHAEPREGVLPPEGTIHAGLVRPSRTEGASPWGYRVEIKTDGEGTLTPFGGLDRTREEALPFGGSALRPDRELVLRGGTCVRARWVGGTSGCEAYDVVLSVAEPLAMRDAPPIYGRDPHALLRLPSFRRALVPLRIVVPHGGVGRRTVMLDLGGGPEPWTVSLSGGRRTE